MELDWASGTALFGVMVVLSAAPGASVLMVSARAAGLGFAHGVATSLGIVTGDVVYIVIAITGLSMLLGALGEWFELVKYLGAAYLFWLGWLLFREPAPKAMGQTTGEATMLSSFLAGLLLTLADQKAILFYLGLFPAFVDLSALSPPDICVIIGLVLLAVGGVKIGYAFLLARSGQIPRPGLRRALNRLAGLSLAGVGIFLLVGS